MLDFNSLRKEYRLKSLDINDLNSDPFLQLQAWLYEAWQASISEPNAMILATASAQAKPSSRTMLLKGIDSQGLRFFTNYESRKARELNENPFASATFLWKEIERQATVEGQVEKISREESEAYFAGRPRGSQLSAWISSQGQVIPNRDLLKKQYEHLEKKYADIPISAPPHWGGYRLIPRRFEFWQGRESRLHDRFQYVWQENQWQIDRLAP